jgi:hypothetical protein
MQLFRVTLLACSLPLFSLSGCEDSHMSGVADAPESPPVEMTPEQEQIERDYAKSQNQ